MQYAIVIRQGADGGFQATVPLLPGLSRSGRTRAEVLEAISVEITRAMSAAEVVMLTLPEPPTAAENPWLATAGLFADDPTLDELLHTIYASRDHEIPGA